MPDLDAKWERLRQDVQSVLDEHGDSLPAESVEAVRHYLEHDEYEIAFEGLCLDLMTAKSSGVDWTRCRELGRRLGLHEESVLDIDFWSKLNDAAGG